MRTFCRFLLGASISAILSSEGGDVPEGWHSVPEAFAQCTDGAKKQGHFAKIRIGRFSPALSLSAVRLPSPERDSVKNAIPRYLDALYLGNGPIFLESGKPGGYLRSNGRDLSPLDCRNFRRDHENLGKENSIFVRYIIGSAEFQYRVVATDDFCKRSDRALPRNARIDFALQSGPGVLRSGKNLLEGYNAAKDYRAYIGVHASGDLIVVESDGYIGSYCLGEYVRSLGVRDLLHRDSSIADAYFQDAKERERGYPNRNRRAEAASLLVIQRSHSIASPAAPKSLR